MFVKMCLAGWLYMYTCMLVAFVHSFMMYSLLNIHPHNYLLITKTTTLCSLSLTHVQMFDGNIDTGCI